MANQRKPEVTACRSNEIAVIGLISIAFMSVAGGLLLSGFGKTVPDWVGNLAIGITGILGGYLSNLLKQPTGSAVTTGTVETVNVTEQVPAREETIESLREKLAKLEATLKEKEEAENGG